MSVDTERPTGSEQRGRNDARQKASGQVRYVADQFPPGVAHAAVVRSVHPHARIVAIDASAAEAAPGVVGVYSARDVTEGTYGRGLRDAPVLARDKVRFVGEKVVAVVAESRVQAEYAASLVEVEYDPLGAVTTMDEALAPGAPLVHERPWEYPGAAIGPDDGANLVYRKRDGDHEAVEAALAAAPHVVDEVYHLASVHQAYLEPQACVAYWDEEGRLQLWLTNKSPYAVRTQVSACLGIDPTQIDVQPTALGGDFGGKGSPEDAPLVAELARLTRRPVKLVLRYSEDLTATNPRAPARIRVRVAADTEGQLLALSQECRFNAGAYGGFTPRAPGPSGTEVGSYRLPLFCTATERVYTNTVPRGNMRAPGAPQGSFAVESALDELAQRVGIDPVELRRRNLLTDGESGAGEHAWFEQRGLETLALAVDALRPQPAPEGWLRGTGIAIYSRATTSVVSTSLRIVPKDDGCVRVELPLTETGAGSHTVARELVSQGLGIDPTDIEVIQVSSDDLPRDAGAGGSRVTASLALAVDAAVKAWQGRLGNEPVMVEVDETAAGPQVGSYCVQFAQVAVDPVTGQLRVLEILSGVDVAAIVNPKAHQMQIDGAAIMGFGYACLEDLDESEGQVWAANLGEFKIASAQDTPALRTVLLHGGRGVGTANVKNIGELANPGVGAATANAVAAATGCRIRELPITAERIFTALQAR